jgi:hypothetical protein
VSEFCLAFWQRLKCTIGVPCQEGKWPKNELEVDNRKCPEIFCQKVPISCQFLLKTRAFLAIFEKSLFRIQVLIIAGLIKILVESLKNQVSNPRHLATNKLPDEASVVGK